MLSACGMPITGASSGTSTPRPASSQSFLAPPQQAAVGRQAHPAARPARARTCSPTTAPSSPSMSVMVMVQWFWQSSQVSLRERDLALVEVEAAEAR